MKIGPSYIILKEVVLKEALKLSFVVILDFAGYTAIHH